MAVERIKFRCYQCNQLLASAPGKAGSIVSCPRCKADLVVPAPESSAAADAEPVPTGKASGRATSTLAQPKLPILSNLDDVAAAIPPDLADLRPEDLRVEAEFFQSLTRAPQPPKSAEPLPSLAGEPVSLAPALDTSPPTTSARPPAEIAAPAAQPLAPKVLDVAPWPATPPPPARPEPDVPPIEIEPPSLLPAGRQSQPVREVVLPAAVVLAWSLFGLIGIAASFIAGLMVGHYIWKS